MNERGPWKLAIMHVPTKARCDRTIPSGAEAPSRAAPAVVGPIVTRKDFLEFIAWCNAQQPGLWQYWEATT